MRLLRRYILDETKDNLWLGISDIVLCDDYDDGGSEVDFRCKEIHIWIDDMVCVRFAGKFSLLPADGSYEFGCYIKKSMRYYYVNYQVNGISTKHSYSVRI